MAKVPDKIELNYSDDFLTDPQHRHVTIFSNTTLREDFHNGRSLVSTSSLALVLTLPTANTFPNTFACEYVNDGSMPVTLTSPSTILLNQSIPVGARVRIRRSASSWEVRILDRTVVPGTQVSIDASGFNGQLSDTDDTAQEVAQALDDLSLTNIEQAASRTFLTSFAITAANIEEWQNHEAIYNAAGDGGATVTLPDRTLTQTTDGAAIRYPLLLRFRHDGGTAVFSTRNRLQINTFGSDPITQGGTAVTGVNLPQGGAVDLRLDAAGGTWRVLSFNSQDPRNLGGSRVVFRSPTADLSTATSLVGSLTSESLSGIQQGYAYTVRGTEDEFSDLYFGRRIHGQSVIVAAVADPSRLTTSDDWLIFPNALDVPVTLQQVRFLEDVKESQPRVVGAKILNDNVIAWISPGTFATAPFIDPTADPVNPRPGETVAYVGARQQYTLPDTPTTAFPSGVLYVGVTPTEITARELANMCVVIEDTEGNNRRVFPLAQPATGAGFKQVSIGASTFSIYIYTEDVVAGSAPNFLNFAPGDNISLRVYNQQVVHTLGSTVDITPRIQDVPVTALDAEMTARLNRPSRVGATARAFTDTLLAFGVTEAGVPQDATGFFWYKTGAPSLDLTHYIATTNAVGLRPQGQQQLFILQLFEGIVSSPTNPLQLRRADDMSVVALTRYPVDLIQGHTTWIATIPASSTPETSFYRLEGAVEQVSNMQSPLLQVALGNLSPDVQARLSNPSSNPTTGLPVVLQTLAQDLTRSVVTESGWRQTQPFPYPFTITRGFAVLWTKNPNTATNLTEFDDLTDLVTVTATNPGNYYYYTSDTAAQAQTVWPGHRAFIRESRLTVENDVDADVAPIVPTQWRIICGFEYFIEAGTTGQQPMVRLGPATEPLIELDTEGDGLNVPVGRGDGGTVTQTVTVPLQVDNRQWSVPVGQTLSDEADIILPSASEATYPLTIDVAFHAWNNNNDRGTNTQQIVVASPDAAATLPNETFTFAANPSSNLTIGVTVATNSGGVTGLNVVRLATTALLNNAALHWDISASYEVSTTVTTSTTYADEGVNTGDPFDRNGIYNVHGYDTDRQGVTNSVMFFLRPTTVGDTSADPLLTLEIIVNGQHFTVNTNRTATNIGFTQALLGNGGIRFGNGDIDIAKIQYYTWSGSVVPTVANLRAMYAARDRWLGAFRDDSQVTDAFTLDGNLIIENPGDRSLDINIGEKLARDTVRRFRLIAAGDLNANAGLQTFVNDGASAAALANFDAIDYDITNGANRYSGTLLANAATYQVAATTLALSDTGFTMGVPVTVHDLTGVKYD